MRSSGNKTMEQILTELHARVMFLRGRSMSLKGRTRYSLSELRAILSAIRNKDPVQAR